MGNSSITCTPTEFETPLIIEIKQSLPQWERHCEEEGLPANFNYPVQETKEGTLNIILANNFQKIETIKMQIDALRPS